jgi:hypothetical protein
MRSVTITVNEEVARWTRIRAAEQSTSLSRMVGEVLREMMRREGSQEQAMQRFLARAPQRLREAGGPYPIRKDLYDKPGLR